MIGIILQILQALAGQPPNTLNAETLRDIELRINGWRITNPAKPAAESNWKYPSDKFADRLLELVKDPWKIQQGRYGWCMAAAFLYLLFRRHPEKMVDFALDIYKEGKSRIGDLKIDSSRAKNPALMDFDLALHAREKSFPLGEQTDWILLAVLHDHMVGNKCTGVIDNQHTTASSSPDDLVDLFKDTKLYNKVEKLWWLRKNLTEIRDEINASADTDVVFTGPLPFFNPQTKAGFHAAALVSPIELEGTKLLFWFWSWGTKRPLDDEDMGPINKGFSKDASVSDMRGVGFHVVVARVV